MITLLGERPFLDFSKFEELVDAGGGTVPADPAGGLAARSASTASVASSLRSWDPRRPNHAVPVGEPHVEVNEEFGSSLTRGFSQGRGGLAIILITCCCVCIIVFFCLLPISFHGLNHTLHHRSVILLPLDDPPPIFVPPQIESYTLLIAFFPNEEHGPRAREAGRGTDT